MSKKVDFGADGISEWTFSDAEQEKRHSSAPWENQGGRLVGAVEPVVDGRPAPSLMQRFIETVKGL